MKGIVSGEKLISPQADYQQEPAAMAVAESIPLISKFERELGIGGTPKVAKSKALVKARSAGTP